MARLPLEYEAREEHELVESGAALVDLATLVSVLSSGQVGRPRNRLPCHNAR